MTPPCKKDGVRCTKRRAGCQETCEAYRPSREAVERAREDRERKREINTCTQNTGRAKSSRKYKKMIGKG